jgi:hypothetical protein
MQTNGQRRPDQNHRDEMVFSFSGGISPFFDKEIGIFWKFCFFMVSVNSTNFGNFIVKIRKKIDTEKKGIKFIKKKQLMLLR